MFLNVFLRVSVNNNRKYTATKVVDHDPRHNNVAPRREILFPDQPGTE